MQDKTAPQPDQHLSTGEGTLVAEVVTPRQASRDIVAVESVMHGLALDRHRHVALEIAWTHQRIHFLLRATSQAALDYLADQVQARYPQAVIRHCTDDPLILAADEAVSAVELCPGAASYLPLRTWREREWTQEGTDPLLGVLAAVSHLPEQTRVVAQLALQPLPPNWSQHHRRKAVEHPLALERKGQPRIHLHTDASVPSTPTLVGLGLLVLLLLLWQQFPALLPHWLTTAAEQLLAGHLPSLSLIAGVQLLGTFALVLVLVFAVRLLLVRLGIGQTRLYDMRLVAEKTGRSAYRVRLRLFVIMARGSSVPLNMSAGAPTGTAMVPVVSSPARRSWSLSLLQYLPAFPACAEVVFGWWRETPAARQQAQLRQQVLAQLTAAYRQYHSAAGGYFVPSHLWSWHLHLLLFPRGGLARLVTGWSADLWCSRHWLSVTDIAALWHLVQAADVRQVPWVEQGRARTFLAPREVTTGNGYRIGTSTHAGQCVPVYLPPAVLRHNLLTVASTGKGKSTLFLHLAQAALSAEAGVMDGLFVLEPHRELISTLLASIPQERADDVVLVDLADHAYPPGINPLDATLGQGRDKAVDNLIVIFEHLWSSAWGPRTENVLEFSLKTLMDANMSLVAADPQHGPDQQYTLLDVVPLLRHAGFRHRIMQQVTDPAITSWWQLYYEPLDLRYQMEVSSSVLTKLSKFVSSLVTRRILGQPRSTLDFKALIGKPSILLISTASGIVGADSAALVGATLLGLFHVTLAEQAERVPEQRRRFLVLVDEFQVFRGVDYNSMLAELRKYGGSFGLATQSLAYLDTLDRTLRQTVLANIDHLFAFDMAAEDARLLEHELDGIEAEDITNLDDYTCYAKLSLAGRRLPLFSLTLDPPAPGDTLRGERIRSRSQRRDARAVASIDPLITQALSRHVPLPRERKDAGETGIAQGQAGDNSTHPSGQATRASAQATQGAPSPLPTSATPPTRHKRRGSGSSKKGQAKETPEQDATYPSRHIIYDQEEPTDREEEEKDDDEDA